MNKYEALVEWYWHEKKEALEGKPVTVPLSPVQIPYGLDW